MAQDGVCDAGLYLVCDLLGHSLLGADSRQPEGVLAIFLFLGIFICCHFRLGFIASRRVPKIDWHLRSALMVALFAFNLVNMLETEPTIPFIPSVVLLKN